MGCVIVITSGKGGTGKTTSAAAISSCLAALGYKTLAVDADAGLRNLDVSLAMSDFAVADFSDVLDGRLGIDDAVREHPLLPNLYFLAAPATLTPEDLDACAAGELLRGVKDSFDYVIVDSPAGLGRGFRIASQGADIAIVVSTGDVSSVRDVSITVDALRNMGVSNCRLLINRVTGHQLRTAMQTLDDIIDNTGARLIGVVREDVAVQDAAAVETPLVLHAIRGAAMDFLDVARRLRGEEIPAK